MKNVRGLLVLCIVILVIVTIPIFIKSKKIIQEQQEKEIEETHKEIAIVPLPSQIDAIQLFFSLINEENAAEAAKMMAGYDQMTDTERQNWGVYFNAFETVKITSIKAETLEPVIQNLYRVDFQAVMNPSSENEPIPYFGYNNGSNVRWIELVQENNLWKIKSINTGP